MEPQIERRALALPRMPVDLMVELSHDGDDDVYEADAIDLGGGGIGLRAAVLPEVGQRLRCRFEVPGAGETCEAQGEVVWAEDSGRWSGAFGVRFDDLDPRAADALEAIAPAPIEDPGTPPELRAPRRVSVRLDGVASPIEGDIVSHGESITIEQSMPFLQIGRGAKIEGGGMAVRGTLERVRLRIEDGMPRLVLELTAERAPSALAVGPTAVAQGSDSTIQDEPLESLIARSVADLDSEADEADDAEGEADEDVRAVVARDETAPPMHVARREREAPRVVTRRESGADEPRDEPMLAVKARQLVSQIGPKMRLAWTAIRAFAVLVSIKALPLALRVRDGIVGGWRTLAGRVASRSPRLATMFGQPARRRTTAAPPVPAAAAPIRRARGTQPPAEVEPSPKNRARTIAIAAIACVAVGLAVYGLSSGESEPAPIEIHRDAATGGSWAATASSLPAVPSVASTPLTQPETIVPLAPPEPMGASPLAAVPAQPMEPRAMPEAASEAGPMPAPSYPTLADRRSDGTAPVTIEAAPSTGERAMEFGAATVERGRTSTLRMSAPIESLEGVADGSGFTVTVQGALSLDRAGPIAASNPAIERASILNRGDHSVLTIRFVEGRDPAYRIVARGTSLDVTIGR